MTKYSMQRRGKSLIQQPICLIKNKRPNTAESRGQTTLQMVDKSTGRGNENVASLPKLRLLRIYALNL